MSTRKSVRPIWKNIGSGLIVPAGAVSNLTHSSTQTYLQIKEKALNIERLYAENSIPLLAPCNLASIIADAKALSDSWLLNQAKGQSTTRLFHAVHLDRIADAILALNQVPDRNKYLTALTTGNLDLLGRERSYAKDVLWELELWSTLKRKSFDVTLSEPDIVVVFEDARIGIACKKLYSDKNVEKVLSQGVAQIAGSFDFGILAVNLDDLLPPNGYMEAPDQVTMGERIYDFNIKFLKAHERHFRKYLPTGRLIAALVSTCILANVSDGRRTRLTNAQQATVWAIPGLPFAKERQLIRFRDQLMG